MVRELEDAGVPCTLVLDASIGYIMSEIDYVLVGAEGVVESGGIINRVIIWGGAESEYKNLTFVFQEFRRSIIFCHFSLEATFPIYTSSTFEIFHFSCACHF
jgi:hypothetical protein